LGVDQLQTRSQQIFEQAIEEHCTRPWKIQLAAAGGMILFWALMAAPILVLYREYLGVAWSVWHGQEVGLEKFPHPGPGLIFTSLLLSAFPLMIYCMIVLTLMLRAGRIRLAARRVLMEHEAAIRKLQDDQVIRVHFEDPLLQQAEYLLNLK
jgi:hypothetical protein